MEIVITTTGYGRCVYDEAIDLNSLGSLTIRRGSHVESTADGRWTADMSPVDGPRLGPFRMRSQALDSERAWLSRNWLLGSQTA